LGEGAAHSRETLDERRAEGVAIVGPAVVAAIPDQLLIGGAGGLQQRADACKVVAARLRLDQMPAQPLANRADAVSAQARVIGDGVAVVAGGGEQIHALALTGAVRRALEASHEKTLEKRPPPAMTASWPPARSGRGGAPRAMRAALTRRAASPAD
jgi:hypothetical protein